jgi:hypothetical protein
MWPRKRFHRRSVSGRHEMTPRTERTLALRTVEPKVSTTAATPPTPGCIVRAPPTRYPSRRASVGGGTVGDIDRRRIHKAAMHEAAMRMTRAALGRVEEKIYGTFKMGSSKCPTVDGQSLFDRSAHRAGVGSTRFRQRLSRASCRTLPRNGRGSEGQHRKRGFPTFLARSTTPSSNAVQELQ